MHNLDWEVRLHDKKAASHKGLVVRKRHRKTGFRMTVLDVSSAHVACVYVKAVLCMDGAGLVRRVKSREGPREPFNKISHDQGIHISIEATDMLLTVY